MKHSSGNAWISLSDLMSALMMIFLFIAVAYMQKVEARQKEVKKITDVYHAVKLELYNALVNEFKEDLQKWDAELDKERLIIRFTAPETLFDVGKTTISPHFQAILRDFFPRYIRILIQKDFYKEIQEIRIEGHTDSDWVGSINPITSYFNNMELSQGRTRKVLEFCLLMPNMQKNFSWLQKNITANGLSSSQTLHTTDGVEDKTRSRRVEFRIITKAEEKINTIIETLG